LRPVAITLILAFTAVVVLADVLLISNLVTGADVTKSATSLLASGGSGWFGTALVFGLSYWEFD
jgi:hypothetical protein